ncbi:hypothetical protein EYF80_055595 [Liparis tanakae]|uniref:Uncharacterized protein n=1 Tax=Liparis tanakae TaxID=230148 RepID=A0A4Z2F0F3_9TELE|nr:hypothetical protein EYF80_055595 [Liparis tanakae]
MTAQESPVSTDGSSEERPHVKSKVEAPIRAPGNQGFSQRSTRSPARITSPQPCSCSSSWAVS